MFAALDTGPFVTNSPRLNKLHQNYRRLAHGNSLTVCCLPSLTERNCTCYTCKQLLPILAVPPGGKKGISDGTMTRTLVPQKRMRRMESGFSMTELAVVVTIILIVIAAAVINMVPSLKNSKSNSAMELVMGELRRAHERAIDERRIYRVTFVAPQTIQVDVGQVAKRRYHDYWQFADVRAGARPAHCFQPESNSSSCQAFRPAQRPRLMVLAREPMPSILTSRMAEEGRKSIFNRTEGR